MDGLHKLQATGLNVKLNKLPEVEQPWEVPPRREDRWYIGVDKILNPFKLLPNMKEFALGVRYEDQIFRAFGLKRGDRLHPIYKSYTNTAANRYILHQVIRLNKARGDPILF